MAFLIKNFDENNVRLLIQCGYDIYADKANSMIRGTMLKVSITN
jgi:hypothetical protein